MLRMSSLSISSLFLFYFFFSRWIFINVEGRICSVGLRDLAGKPLREKAQASYRVLSDFSPNYV